MKIDFFEEFPNEKNLQKAGFLIGQSLVYVAAHSLEEFDAIAFKLRAINPNLSIGYWPILKKSYWVSPFSYTYELRGLRDELKNRSDGLEVLLDLELPLLRPSLFLRNLFSFFQNRSIIRKLFLLTNIRFSTAEYPIPFGAGQLFLQILGITYSTKRYGHERILMYYSSMFKKVFPPFNIDFRPWFLKALKKEIEKDKSIVLGLGTISVGAFGNEPILPASELESDLEYCLNLGLSRIVIFRLAGLTEEYASVIAKFAS